MTTELQAVNRLIEPLGEDHVVSLDDFHPLVPSARAKITDLSRRIQARGWWFNKERLILTPDVGDGQITVPNDLEDLVPVSSLARLAVRGTRLYNLDTNSYIWDAPIELDVVRILPLASLPATAAEFVVASAVVEFVQINDGDSAKLRELKEIRSVAYGLFQASHIRNQRPNLLRDGTFGQKAARITAGRLPI